MPLSVRIGLVLGGLRNFRVMAVRRTAESRNTAEYYAGKWDTGEPRDSTGELVERFAKLASENEKSAARHQKLIDRILVEGLPPEVVSWRPER